MKTHFLNKFFSILLQLSFVSLISIIGLTNNILLSQTSKDDPEARTIMEKVLLRDTGKTSQFLIKMTLIDNKKNQRHRTIKVRSKDEGDLDKTIMTFQNPADVKGTGFLTFDYDNRPTDDQWLYLPALKKTKRIPSGDKSSSFMGSDFSNYDLSSPDLKSYTYRLIKETKISGNQVWMIEATPKNKEIMEESGYKKSEVYVDQESYMVLAGKHYLADSNKYKLFKVLKKQKIDGIWFTTKNLMVTKQGKQTLHQTLMETANIKVNIPISDNEISIRSLEKGL